MGKFTRTWSLMADCWQVLKRDTALLLFPLISSICCVLLLVSFIVPLYTTGAWHLPTRDASTSRQVAYYGVLFLFYFCNYFIVVFFNAGIIACATIRMTGGNPTLGDGFRAAASRLPVILGWALISATFGLVLRIIEDRSKSVGRIVAGLVGMAWTVVSYLVIPILVVENKNPFTALKDSTAYLKKTWGEQLVGNFSFGLVFLVLSLPAVLVVILGATAHNTSLFLGCLALAVIYWIALGLVQSALQSIFQAALYLYARDGQVPDGFRAETLSGAMS